MKIDEALIIIRDMISEHIWDVLDTKEYKALTKLLDEYLTLRKEISRLAIESVEREKEVSRLEGDILAWKLYHTKG